MIYVMYTSSASHLMSSDELMRLLHQSRENNRRQEVTGMLLYSDGNFVQVLEGLAEVVDPLLKKIERDPRHKGVLEMLRGDLEERQFPEWSMGFRNLTDLSPEDRASVSGFLLNPSPESGSDETAHESLKLLQVFRRLMR
ncbi:MAG: BLUF domain-containing protein [Armatimonadota bacterium]